MTFLGLTPPVLLRVDIPEWVDINLTVNQNTVPLIFKLLADPSSRIRQATAYALLRLVTKGLKAPSDKLQLIRVLSLGEVLESLETKSRDPPGSAENEEEDLYREGLGKLANGLGLELVDLLGEASLPPEGREITEQLVAQLLPVCIQFLADPFDDTSSTVFTFFSQLFSHVSELSLDRTSILRSQIPHAWFSIRKHGKPHHKLI